jgi:hypothetical protein
MATARPPVESAARDTVNRMAAAAAAEPGQRKHVSWDPLRSVSPVPSLQRLHKRARTLSDAALDELSSDDDDDGSAQWASSCSSSDDEELEADGEADAGHEEDVDDDSSDVDLDDEVDSDDIPALDATAAAAAGAPARTHRRPSAVPELPTVVLAGVLARCGLRQAALVARTCSAWRAAFRSPSAWRELDLVRLFGTQRNRWLGESLLAADDGRCGENGGGGSGRGSGSSCVQLPSALRSFCAFLLADGGCRLSQLTSLRVRASQHDCWIASPAVCEVPSPVLLRLISGARLLENVHISGRVKGGGEPTCGNLGSLLRLRACSMAVGVQDRSWLRVFGGLGGVCQLALRLRFAGEWANPAVGTCYLTAQLNCMPRLQQLSVSCIDSAPSKDLQLTAAMSTGASQQHETVGLPLTGLVLPALRQLNLTSRKPWLQVCKLGPSCSLPALEEVSLRWVLSDGSGSIVPMMIKELVRVCAAFGPEQCPALRQLVIHLEVPGPSAEGLRITHGFVRACVDSCSSAFTAAISSGQQDQTVRADEFSRPATRKVTLSVSEDGPSSAHCLSCEPPPLTIWVSLKFEVAHGKEEQGDAPVHAQDRSRD